MIEDITACQIVETGCCESKHPMGMPAGNCFEIIQADAKPWYLYAHTASEMKAWANAIRNNAELIDAGYGNRRKEAAARPRVVPTVRIDADLRQVNTELRGLSVKELKVLLIKHGGDVSGAVEKDDLFNIARNHVGYVAFVSFWMNGGIRMGRINRALLMSFRSSLRASSRLALHALGSWES